MLDEVIHLHANPEAYVGLSSLYSRRDGRAEWMSIVYRLMRKKWERFNGSADSGTHVRCADCGCIHRRSHLAQSLHQSKECCESMQSPWFYTCSCGATMCAETGETEYGGCGQCRGCAGSLG